MNYYQVLGVPEKASDKDIKRAYKKLVKKYHPDIFHGDKEFAENKIKDINEAYETLSDPMLKSEYDALLYGSNDNDSYGPSHKPSQAEDNYNNNLRYRDNDFYNSDSYRHYSSRYYGRSRPSQEFEDYKRAEASKNKSSDFLDALSKPKILLLIAIISVIMIIVLIILLSILKDLTSPSNMFNDLNNGSQNKGILIIEKGLPYSTVKEYYGEPTNIQYVNSGFYAYYGDSYILFNNDYVITDWVNYGDFVTSYPRGQQEQVYNEIYNELQNVMYFDV